MVALMFQVASGKRLI